MTLVKKTSRRLAAVTGIATAIVLGGLSVACSSSGTKSPATTTTTTTTTTPTTSTTHHEHSSGGGGGGGGEAPATVETAPPAATSDSHTHGNGPNGGVVFDLGSHHAEFTVDHPKQEATVLFFDAPVAATEFVLNIQVCWTNSNWRAMSVLRQMKSRPRSTPSPNTPAVTAFRPCRREPQAIPTRSRHLPDS